MKYKSILVVDDEEDICHLFQKLLQPLGAVCLTATDGAQALEMATSQHFDLIISDVKMPILDGFKFVELLKEETQDLPEIIFMTGHTDYDVDVLKSLGATLILQKPVSVMRLLEYLKAA